MMTNTCLLIKPYLTDAADLGRQQKDIQDVIKPAIKLAALELKDEDGTIARELSPDLIKRVFDAEIVVVDANSYNTSGEFPTVPYLLGVRHARGSQTILVLHRDVRLPYSLVTHHTITYLRESPADFYNQFTK